MTLAVLNACSISPVRRFLPCRSKTLGGRIRTEIGGAGLERGHRPADRISLAAPQPTRPAASLRGGDDEFECGRDLVSNEPTLAFTSVETRTTPIVFANVTYAGIGRHHDNVTGIIAIEPQVAEKWVSVLKDLVPGIERVGFLHAPPSAPKDFLQATEAAAAHGLKPAPVALPLPRPGEPTLETMIAQFAAEPNGGLVVMPSFITALVRPRIIAAAAQYRVPAIYGHRFFAAEGGLISYGTDIAQSFVQAASYIDRILKGETPADLPLHPPSRYDLVLNLKTAKAMGLDVPVSVLALADEVIE
jgi:putative tryptophan/tyrosine transport system substrate-binding protein